MGGFSFDGSGISANGSELAAASDSSASGLAINDDNCYTASGINTAIFKSINSKPLDKINLPEVRDLSVDFEYNYFTKDERIRPDIPGDLTLVSIDGDNTDEIFQRAVNQKQPRLVKISFKKPKAGGQTLRNSQGLGNFNPEDVLDNILIEGAISNEMFTGFELLDTNREQKIYSMLKAAQTFIDVRSENDTEKSAAEKMHNLLSENGGLFGADKLVLLEALSTLNTNSFKVFSSDSLESKTSINDTDPIGRQTFSLQMNNLLMSDIIKSATRIPDNVFQDELRGLESFASQIKADLIENLPPLNTFNTADYELRVNAIKMIPIDNIKQSNIIDTYPKISFAGYLIEKYELLPNEGIVYIGKILIQNPEKNFFVDNDVAYGRSYFYKIRTVCEIDTIVSTDNTVDPSLNQVMIATILVGSEGKSKSILCVENKPPPPPTGIRATFDFVRLIPRISWQFPINKQRDIKRFQIFKRLSVESPFTLLAEYDFDDSEIRTPPNEIANPQNIYFMRSPRLSFVDETHNEGEKPIYTVACVDAHGLSSNYGPQVRVERDRYTNRVTRKIISGPNAPKPYPNLLLNNDAFLDAIKVSNYKNIKLFLDPEYYQVFKHTLGETSNDVMSDAKMLQAQAEQNSVSVETYERNLNFLAIDPNKFTYKLQIINVDNQKDQIVNIKIGDISTVGANEVTQPAENFNINNISFQFGV